MWTDLPLKIMDDLLVAEMLTAETTHTLLPNWAREAVQKRQRHKVPLSVWGEHSLCQDDLTLLHLSLSG